LLSFDTFEPEPLIQQPEEKHNEIETPKPVEVTPI